MADAAFTAWLTANGFSWHPALELRPHSVFSTGASLPKGLEVCRLPKASMLTVRTTAAAEALAAAGLRGAVGLAVALLHERSLGDKSHWAPYLATLPVREPLPVSWTAEQLQLLKGTELEASVQADLARMRADWEQHVQPLARSQPGVLPPAFATLEAYLDARTLTASRSFAVDAYHGEGMVPLADLFNHEDEEHTHFTGDGEVCPCCGAPEAEAEADDEADEEAEEEKEEAEEEAEEEEEEKPIPPRPAVGAACPLCKRAVQPLPPDECLSMVLFRALDEGVREVWNTYGRHGPAELLHLHGFTTHPGRRAKVFIEGSALHAALGARLLPKRLQLAARMGLVPEDDGLAGCEAFELRGERWAEEDAEEEEEEGAFCPFPRDLMLVLNLLLADSATAAAANRAMAELERLGSAQVPVLTMADLQVTAEDVRRGAGEASEYEELTEVEEILWQLLANAALRGGYLAPPPAPVHAFLLAPPAVREVLRTALRTREERYGPGIAALEEEEVRLEALRPARSPPVAEELPMSTHALQVRVCERRVIRAAMSALESGEGAEAVGEKRERETGAEEEQQGPSKRTAADAAVWGLFN